MVFLRKYGVLLAGTTTIRIPIRKAGSADYATGSDWTPATGDVKVSLDSGVQANITNLPTYANGSWQFVLTAAELTAKSVEIRVVDSATKAIDDAGFNVETFGHASAMHLYDTSDGVRLGLTSLPNVAANAVGGLPVLDASSRVAANVQAFGGTAGTFNAGRPEVNSTHWAGTAVGSALVRSNVIQYNGVAGTFSGGRPEVNTSHWGGTAIATALVRANIIQVAGAGITNVNDFKATGFATPLNVTDARDAILAQGNTAWTTATGFAVPGSAMTLTIGERGALALAIEAEIANDATGEDLRQLIADKIIENLPDLDDLTLTAIAAQTRDAILDRVLAGNHNTAGTTGALLQKLNVTGTIANTDNANDFKADISSLLTTTTYNGSLPANFSLLAIGLDGSVTDQDAGGGTSYTLTQIGDEVAARLVTYDAPTKAELDAAQAAIIAHGDGAWITATGFAVPGDLMGLTESAIEDVTVAVELEMFNDATGQALRQAIVDKLIENLPDLDDLSIAAIRNEMERSGGLLDQLVARATEVRLAKLDVVGTIANTDNADTFKADVSTLATQASVDAIAADLDGHAPVTLVRAIDRFIGAAATELSTTTPTGGGQWVRNPTSGNHVRLDGNGNVYCDAWNGMYYHSLILDKNQWAAMDVKKNDVFNAGRQGGGPAIRVNASTNLFISGRYTPNLNAWEIVSPSGQLAVSAPEPLPDRCRLLLVGIESKIYLFVDGVLKCEAVDQEFREPGGVGFRLFQVIATALNEKLLWSSFAGGEVSITNHLVFDPDASHLTPAEQTAIAAAADMALTFDTMHVDGVYTEEALANAASPGLTLEQQTQLALAAEGTVADTVIDKSNPLQWQLVSFVRGTNVEISRKNMYDDNGNPYSSTNQVTGRMIEA